jgi:hypothetical protein
MLDSRPDFIQAGQSQTRMLCSLWSVPGLPGMALITAQGDEKRFFRDDFGLFLSDPNDLRYNFSH